MNDVAVVGGDGDEGDPVLGGVVGGAAPAGEGDGEVAFVVGDEGEAAEGGGERGRQPGLEVEAGVDGGDVGEFGEGLGVVEGFGCFCGERERRGVSWGSFLLCCLGGCLG